MEDLREFEARLDFQFEDYSLLQRALTHRSFVNENPQENQQDNERLEFLGDAVIDFVVAAYLFDHFPDMDEGQLTMLRSALVRTNTLAGIAQQLGVGLALHLGIGEDEGGGRERLPNLCAAFEAIVGAIYLDQGLDKAEQWIVALIPPVLEQIIAAEDHIDAKSGFQIWSQAQHNITPNYQVISSEGPDHDKRFTVAVLVGDEIWGTGIGSSKQLAAQEAARSALDQVEKAAATVDS
jgi:ribonuclease-3